MVKSIDKLWVELYKELFGQKEAFEASRDREYKQSMSSAFLRRYNRFLDTPNQPFRVFQLDIS